MVSIFWLGWSVSPGTHWIAPVLSGVPFGAGFVLIFIALLNYMTDAYGEYGAGAVATVICTRSVFGALLPLARPAGFARLGVAWGMSLLGFLTVLLGLVPFALIRYGRRIRMRSELCKQSVREQDSR